MLNLYDLFEREEQPISLVLLLGKDTGITMQETFFLKKKIDSSLEKCFGCVADPAKIKIKL